MSAPPAGHATVGLLRRMAAMLYDGMLVVAILFLFSVPLVVVNDGEAIAADTAWYRAYLLLLTGAYFIFFWVRGGQTLGMKSWRFRVLTAEGRPLDVRQALARCVAAVLSWLPAGAGFLWCLVDRDHLAWHDRLSGTRLVRVSLA